MYNKNLVAMVTLREKWQEMHNLRWTNYSTSAGLSGKRQLGQCWRSLVANVLCKCERLNQMKNIFLPVILLFLCPYQVEAYDADELNFHGGMRVSFAMQLMGAVNRIERDIPSISWPFMILHGDDDKLCCISGSKTMYETAPSSDKKIKVGMN